MRRPPSRARPARRTRPRAGAGPVAALGVACVVACGAPAPARAQSPADDSPVALDVGLARIRQAGTPPLVAPSVGASWRARRGRGAAGVAAAAAAGDGRTAAQLAVDGSRAFGPADAPRELTAELRGVRVPNTPWAAQLLAGVRQQVAWGRGGAWVGAQGGVVRQVGVAWPSGAAEAGAWWPAGRAGRVAVTAAAATARVHERGLVAAGINAYGPSRVHTGDLVASYARSSGRVEASAWAGARAYAPRGLRALPRDDEDPRLPGAPLRVRGVAAASVTAWLVPAVALSASAGVLPNDPVRGLPAAAHLVLGLRVRPWPRAAGRAARGRAGGAVNGVANRGANGGANGAVTGTAAGPVLRNDDAPAAGVGGRVVRVAAGGALRVRLRGDATGWRPVELARGAGGDWWAALALASGTHRVVVRVDDGPWRPPANLPAVTDDLGGEVGLLVVP